MKKIFLLSVCSAILLSLAACGNSSSGENGEVIVYNWGEYLDPEAIALFEEETGIKVIYDEFETNEIMYPLSLLHISEPTRLWRVSFAGGWV